MPFGAYFKKTCAKYFQPHIFLKIVPINEKLFTDEASLYVAIVVKSGKF